MTLFNHILQWAENRSLLIQQDDDNIVFQTDGQAGSWISRVKVMEEDGMIFILSAYPFHVAQERREAAALALGEITSGLKLGTFYLDEEDGQINFRLGQFLWPTDEEETTQRVNNMIMLALSVVDTYYRKMLALAAEE